MFSIPVYLVQIQIILHVIIATSEESDKFSPGQPVPGNERLNKPEIELSNEKTCPENSVAEESCVPNYPSLDLCPNSNLQKLNSPETKNTEQKSKQGSVKKRKGKMEENNLIALEFEVFGKVQGVFFRKFTTSKSKELGLHGWVQNTDKGTVLGELEGPADKVRAMKKWLRDSGSPKSKIVKAEFRNERNIPRFSFSSFDIRR